jgi:hypothetical protein
VKSFTVLAMLDRTFAKQPGTCQMEPLWAILFATLMKRAHMPLTERALNSFRFEKPLERCQVLNHVLSSVFNIIHTLPFGTPNMNPFGLRSWYRGLNLHKGTLPSRTELTNDRMACYFQRRAITTFSCKVFLVNFKVSASVAKVISGRNLINAIAPLVHRNIARVAKNDLILRIDLSVEAYVAYRIHILIKLRLPSKFGLL